MGNPVFEIVEPDYVKVVSRVWLVSGPELESEAPVMSDAPLLAGTFVDQLVMIDGQWLVSRRDGSVELKHGTY